MTDSPSASGPAPESGRNFDRLKGLLRQMFQLDRGDLDFGLYRIMNMKAGEIEAFLERDLLPQVTEALAGVAAEQRVALQAELDKAVATARSLRIDPEKAPKVIELREQLAVATADADAEADVYGHLFNFFDRYYREGDFMSLRRYSGGGEPTYLIPYDGEEVKLHWANADQYYVKTTENYASYAFTAGEADAAFRVRFEIAAADNEKDNIKEASGKQRRFVLAEDAVAPDDDELVVRFEHRPLTEREKRDWPGNGATQQGRINATVAARVLTAAEELDPAWPLALAAPVPTATDPDRTLLAKHVERYTAKNSFDYFIHKDLGGFLGRELDLYLKTDVLDLQDLALGDADRLRRALGRMRAVREIGGKLIAFLAQLEDFQKRLWLKKKFVLETQWCVTLDRVPEALYPEIAANEAQRVEWQALFTINEIAGDDGAGLADGFAEASPGYLGESGPAGLLSPGFLKANPFLVLDTRHFDRDFKDRLLAALSGFGPLDEQTDGFLVHGENFQALNLLQAQYHGQIKCVYIDPPYNTDATPITYKNGYRHSSWLAMIDSRTTLTRLIMSNEAILCIAIDDFESHHLRELLATQLPNFQMLGAVAIKNNPAGRTGTSGFSICHEYVLFYGQVEMVKIGRLEHTEVQKSRYKERDEIGPFEWTNFRKHGGTNTYRDTRPRQFYPIYARADGKIRIPNMSWDNISRTWTVNDTPALDEETILPIDNAGRERIWDFTVNTALKNVIHLQVRKDSKGKTAIYRKWRINEEGLLPQTIWDRSEYSATEYGTNLLTNMFGETHKFSFPKSIFAVSDCLKVANLGRIHNGSVLDYFAGSGTTGHAVIALNREDGGERKYILAEMGDHFNTVMLPRLKKATYAPDWKDGKPVARDKGVSQLIRYVRLESYEDTLDGLVATPPEGDLLAENDTAMVEDYRLRYALAAETAASPCLLGRDFRDPFAYTLSVVRDGVRRETPVDLPETFNLLLGLRVESRRRLDGVLAIAGKDPQGQNCLILWRNLDETDNEALNRWLRRHRKAFPAPDLIYANGDHILSA
ncbi:MAG: site-specific DNA-methyltransferase, partial [Alphaproteobacteria bacterium]|nr:site-specific DNA-methyltransferase [Alphaproteobacteria bacterium]